MASPLRRIFILGLALIITSGCATLKGRHAFVKVVSDPPGAQVFLEGTSTPLGLTPLFAPIPRQRKQSLVLRANETRVRTPLESGYRWQESFLANLGWISPVIWPIGWTTDLISGAAWDYDPIGPVMLPIGSSKKPLEHPIRIIAIAPPLSDFEVLSEEMALEVQKQMSERFPNARVLPYENTSDTFVAYNYTFKSPNDPRFNDELSQELGATHLVQTELRAGPGKVHTKVRLRDVFLDRDVGTLEFDVPRDEVSALRTSRWRELLLRSVSLIPNSVNLQVLSESRSEIGAQDTSGNPYRAQSESKDSVIDYVSRVSLRNVLHPKAMRGFKGRFRFIPDFAFTSDKFHLFRPGSESSIGQFHFQSLHAGFGPELGLETPAGYLYLQLVPVFAHSWIRSSRPAPRSTIQKDEIAASVEGGFLFWLSDSFNVRFYVLNRSANSKTWQEAFVRAGESEIRTNSTSLVSVGIAVGYYIPEIKNLVRRSLL